MQMSKLQTFGYGCGVKKQGYGSSLRVRSIKTKVMITEQDIQKCILNNGTVDYYELLGIDDDAGLSDIKSAYRSLAKQCHPDRLGQQGHDVCTLLNEAYHTLQHPLKRQEYDATLEEALSEASEQFTGKPLSKWLPTQSPHLAKNTDPEEDRAVWVDEVRCIGCKNCIFTACGTFRLEPTYGKARAYAQWVDTEEDMQVAIDTCPVDCIHFVHKDDLPYFEYITQVKHADERPFIFSSHANCGNTFNLFDTTHQFMEEQRKKELEGTVADKKVVSTQQKAQYKRAVRVILSAQFGWLSGMIDQVIDVVLHDAEVQYDSNVGQRKRAHMRGRRQAMLDDRTQDLNRTPIPQHLALVPFQANPTPQFTFKRATQGAQ